MKTTELEKCKQDTKWIKIDFLTPYSKGSMIMKESFYLKKQKQIEKKLSKYYWINYDYKLTLEECIQMDEEHQKMTNHLKRMNMYLQYAIKHDQNEEYKNSLILQIREIESDIRQREEYLFTQYHKEKEELDG